MAQTKTCADNSSQPGCVIPQLYGKQGLVLPNNFHRAHFLSDFQTNFTPLNSAIATQLAILPLISPASGFTYKFDDAAGVYVRSSTSFGPILTERAETIGRNRFFFGAGYQRFRFSTLDGQDLHNLPSVFHHAHEPAQDVNGQPAPYESDFISTSNDVDLKVDQVTVFATYGVTDRLDVSVAIPFLSTRLSASSEATINRVALPSTRSFPTSCGLTSGQAHYFDPCNPETSTRALFTNSGSASGVGDVIFRVKGSVLQTQSVQLALLLDVRVPSGNERDFLGSGAAGLRPFVAISIKKRVSPHVNLGYQWNGSSVLAGDISTGSKRRIPSQAFYSLGTDVGVTSRLTFAVDYLGQTLINAPRLNGTEFQAPTSAIFPGGAFPGIGFGKSTYTLSNGAAGIKYNLFSKLLLTANILFRMDNHGLRQDVTPLIGLSYLMGR